MWLTHKSSLRLKDETTYQNFALNFDPLAQTCIQTAKNLLRNGQQRS